MIDVRILGDRDTVNWLERQKKALDTSGFDCRVLVTTGEMKAGDSSDLWIVDADASEPEALKTTLNELQAPGPEQPPPVVVMGKSIGLDVARDAVKAGAHRFLSKPLTRRVLAETCSELGIPRTQTIRKTLVIEDREEVYGQICELLAFWSIDVIVATSVEDAFDLLREQEFDIIVTGHYPDSLSRPELVALMRFAPESGAMPLILITEDISEGEALKCLTEGIYFSQRSELAAAVSRYGRARGSQKTSGGRIYHLLYELDQEHRALNHHAIVSKTDQQGRITEVNRRFCEISKYAEDELLGRTHQMLKSGHHPPQFYRDLWTTIAKGEVWQGEICNRAKDGELYWVSSTIVPILDGQKRPSSYIAIRKDITHLKRSEQQIEVQSKLARLISELGAKIQSGNWANAVDTLQEALQPLSQFLGIDRIAIEIHQDDHFLDAWRETQGKAGQPPGLSIIRCSGIRKTPESQIDSRFEIPLEANGMQFGSIALFTPGNTPAPLVAEEGLMDVLANVISQALRRLISEYHRDRDRDRLRRAQTFAHVGTWEWNIETNELFWTEIIPVLFGYPEGDLETSYDNFITAVHPDDRQRVEEAINAAVRNDSFYQIKHRVLWPDGTVRWLLESGAVQRGPDGTAKSMSGIVKDVTAEREVEEKIAQQTGLLNMLHDSLTDFVLKGKLGVTLDAMLKGLLDLTGSEFGFLAEIAPDRDLTPFIKAQSVACAFTSTGGEKTCQRDDPATFDFCSLEDRLGISLADSELVVMGPARSAGFRANLQNGGPEIKTFLKVPVFVDHELVGTFALANRTDGYEPSLIELLRPFVATYGVIVHSQRMLEMREITQRSLIRAKMHADQANQAKSEFLSSMSHELRTPLNAILGFGQLLQVDDRLDEEQQDDVAEILAAGKHLLTLINEVLDLAKIESGKLELSLEPVSVQSVIEEALSLIKHSAADRGIRIMVREIGDLHVVADWTRLKQALLNLLSNAVKYNRPHGEIVIEARLYLDAWLDIRISDTGYGIPDARIEELFQPFNRLGAELGHIEGTGIGLSLTRQLLELMGGSLGVSSVEGKGSTFWARMPLKPEDAGINATSALPMEGSSHDLPKFRVSGQKSILHIEDNPANQKLVARILERQPEFFLFSAFSAEEGLELAESHRPDLVLLDINLPTINGYEILSRLKAHPQLKDRPVIALTANAMQDEVGRGQSSGFDHYLTKPVNIESLMSILEKYLGERSL